MSVFDWFDVLAYPDDHAAQPNRLRAEYGGEYGDGHPNEAANADSTEVFATNAVNFIGSAWAAFSAGGEGEGEGEGERVHTADQNGDKQIDLSELLRVGQLYRSGSFHCQVGTEDGYAPGVGGVSTCAVHASDYNPEDWRISLSELLRLIQFHNAGGYHACPDADPSTEDRYCLGAT